MRRLGQVPGFDGLRGLAVMIVLVAHLNVILPIPQPIVIPGGTVSLDMFFVLSGFLITTLLLREQGKTGRVDKVGFYRRRALRLLPALIAMLAAYAIFAAVSGVAWHDEWTSILSVSFYYSNWKLALNSNALGGHIAPGLQHLWSLSFEEQFYLIWPWVTIVILTLRQRLRTVVIVLVGLIVAIAVHRAITYHGLDNWYSTFIRTDTRADSILIGALLAHVWIRGREPRRYVRAAAWIAAGVLLVCLPTLALTNPFLYRGGFTLIDVSCAVLLLAVLDGRWIGRRLFELRVLVILGTVSYGMYMWHLPIFFAIERYGSQWNSVLRVTMAAVITFMATALSWFLIERPALRWKDRLEARNVQSSALEAQAPAGRAAAVVEDRQGVVDSDRLGALSLERSS